MTARTPVPEHLRPQDRKATEPQINYLSNLLQEREMPAKGDATGDQRTATAMHLIETNAITFQQAKDCIDYLLTCPRRDARMPLAGRPSVEAGRYAVIDADDVVKFYRVDRPTEGRWAGYTFVKVQASDDYYPVKGASAIRVLNAIVAQGPRECMERYGREIGRCGVCGRTLTDETSREIGIGPVCRENL